MGAGASKEKQFAGEAAGLAGSSWAGLGQIGCLLIFFPLYSFSFFV